ncbi:MAG: hypothetical protein AAF224_14760 [Pseudomonadota bacterium]
MSSALSVHPLRMSFFRWQCRTRQMAMRQNGGRPDESMTPAVRLEKDGAPIANIITLINKSVQYSHTAELMQIAKKTNDPAQRREGVIRLLSAAYYQRASEFADGLTATFAPDSDLAKRLTSAGICYLSFDAYAQRFDLECRVRLLDKIDPLHPATWWHNFLFNPTLAGDAAVLVFEPDWPNCTADPSP